MNKRKLTRFLSAAAAVGLLPAPAFADPISMGMKLEHVVEDGKDGGKVTALRPAFTAAALGFKVGDVLIEAGGQPITPQIFRDYMKDKKAGDELVFKVKRGAQVVELMGKAVASQ